MTPLVNLSAFQRDLLAVVRYGGPASGVTLRRTLADARGERIRDSRFYDELNDLVSRGLVEKGSIDGRTNSYEIAARGRRELAADSEWRTQT